MCRVRDALEKDKAEALAAARAANDAETRKLTGQLEDLRRKLEKQRAVELGEGAEAQRPGLREDHLRQQEHRRLAQRLRRQAGATQLEVRDGVVIVSPARAVAIVRIIRRQMLLVHTLRLSKAERTSKMAELYDFITSERCVHLLGRIDTESDALLELQAAEVRAHQNHWKREGTLVRSLQKAKAQLEVEIESIIGAREAE